MRESNAIRLNGETLETREVPAATPIFAVGGGSGSSPRVQVFNVNTGNRIADFMAYENTFTGGVQTAIGDVNEDGFADLIVGAGVGGGPRVRIFDGRAFSAFAPSVPQAPLDGKSQASQAIVLADFFAFESTQRGGTTVAAGNFFGITNADVVIGAGPGGGPRIRILDGQEITKQGLSFTSNLQSDTIANFFAFESTFRNGVNVSAPPTLGERSFLVAAPGLGGGPRVRVLDGNQIATQQRDYSSFRFGDAIADFFVGDRNNRTGLFVTSGDFNKDGFNDVAVGTGPGQAGSFTIYNGQNLLLGNFTGTAFNDIIDQFTFANYTSGVTVGAAVQTQRTSFLIVGTGNATQQGRAAVVSFAAGNGFITRTTVYDLIFDSTYRGGVFVSQ